MDGPTNSELNVEISVPEQVWITGLTTDLGNCDHVIEIDGKVMFKTLSLNGSNGCIQYNGVHEDSDTADPVSPQILPTFAISCESWQKIYAETVEFVTCESYIKLQYEIILIPAGTTEVADLSCRMKTTQG